MLPAVLYILGHALVGALVGGAIGGAVGFAIDVFFMDDEDTQAVADCLVENNHPRLLKAFCFLVRVRRTIRRMIGVQLRPQDDEVTIVREHTLSMADLPDDVRAQFEQEGELAMDITDQLKRELSLTY